MAIDQECNHYYQFVEGYTTSEHFKTFIESLPLECGTSLLMDNASIHKSAQMKSVFSRKGFNSLFIPPYSPECNPIENVFSSLKHSYRKQAMDFKKYPIDILKHILNKVIDRTMYQRCFLSMERHIESYKSINSVDLNGILSYF